MRLFPTYADFCGLKGMMPGIFDMLKAVCAQKGLNYDEWFESELRHPCLCMLWVKWGC